MSLAEPAPLCPACGGSLGLLNRSTTPNADGTSGDAELTRWSCTICRHTCSRWRIPSVVEANGQLVTRWREQWSG